MFCGRLRHLWNQEVYVHSMLCALRREKEREGERRREIVIRYKFYTKVKSSERREDKRDKNEIT